MFEYEVLGPAQMSHTRPTAPFTAAHEYVST